MFSAITGFFRENPDNLMQRIEGMNSILSDLAIEQLSFGIHQSNVVGAESIRQKLTQDLKEIDPALVNESRYASSLWAPVKKVYDLYYAFRNFRFKDKILALNEYLSTIDKIYQRAKAELNASDQQISSLIRDVIELQPKPQSIDCNWATRLVGHVWNWWRPQPLEKPIAAAVSSSEIEVITPATVSAGQPLNDHIKQSLAKGKEVTWNNGTNASTFSGYFYERVFMQNNPIDQGYNSQTREFTLKFQEEKKVKFTKMPPGKSLEVQNLLKQVMGKTLVIAKEVKGKLDIEGNSIEFSSGSLKAPLRFGMTAQLSKIGIDPLKDPSALRLTGSFLGKEGTVKINVQDFVDLFEANLE